MADSTKSQVAVAKPASHAKNDIEKDKFILKQLVTKDFKIKYRRSVLGIAWSVLNPLLMMIVMSIVFYHLWPESQRVNNSRDVPSVPDCGKYYIFCYVRVDKSSAYVNHLGIFFAQKG